MRKKKPSEKAVTVAISIAPEVLAYLDKMAEEMKVSRSGLITNFIMVQKAMDENKDLNKLVTTMIKRAIKP